MEGKTQETAAAMAGPARLGRGGLASFALVIAPV